MKNLRTGLSFAATAALVAISATSTPAFAQQGRNANVHCYGVNTCRGQSACRTASNECRGQNTCRGQGFRELTARQCRTQGGSLTAPAAPAAPSQGN